MSKLKPHPTEEKHKDKKHEAVEKNPCGKCRAQGYPVCMGHGSAGGGGSSSNASGESPSESKGAAASLTPAPNPKTPRDLCSLLALNEDWIQKDDQHDIYKFDNPDALFTMELDMEHGKLSIMGRKGLTKEQYDLLGRYLTSIKNELSEFIKELKESGVSANLIDQITMTHEGNILTIKFPGPEIYDKFLQRLVDKNLLPAQAAPKHYERQEKTLASALTPLLDEELDNPYKSTAPTPFDAMRKGPKPEGFE